MFSCVLSCVLFRLLSFICSLLFALFCLLSFVRSLLFAPFRSLFCLLSSDCSLFFCSLLFVLFCLLSFLRPPLLPLRPCLLSRFPPPFVFSSSLWFFLKIISFLAADNAGFAKMITNFHFRAVRIGQKSARDKKQDSY